MVSANRRPYARGFVRAGFLPGNPTSSERASNTAQSATSSGKVGSSESCLKSAVDIAGETLFDFQAPLKSVFGLFETMPSLHIVFRMSEVEKLSRKRAIKRCTTQRRDLSTWTPYHSVEASTFRDLGAFVSRQLPTIGQNRVTDKDDRYTAIR